VATVARIRAVGGRHDGGLVEDLGTSYEYVDPHGQAYPDPAPGRVLHHWRFAFQGGPAMSPAWMCECGGILLEPVTCPLCGHQVRS
jgi:hypothetical protein